MTLRSKTTEILRKIDLYTIFFCTRCYVIITQTLLFTCLATLSTAPHKSNNKIDFLCMFTLINWHERHSLRNDISCINELNYYKGRRTDSLEKYVTFHMNTNRSVRNIRINITHC